MSVLVAQLAMLSLASSSSSAAWRPRLSAETRLGRSGVGEGEAEVEDAGAAALVRVLRCLLVHCFVLASALAVVTVRDVNDSMLAMVYVL